MNPRLSCVALAFCAGLFVPSVSAQNRGVATPASTRITDPKQHEYDGRSQYPFRDRAEYILGELDLKSGDVVVDVGAGDGWWSERLSKEVGSYGVVHSAEVVERLVNQMKERFADTPNVKPYLTGTDGTSLPENSVYMAFFSQVYHHLDADGKVDYLKHLHDVVKPTGRICIIEKVSEVSTRTGDHGTKITDLAKVAEEAGWVLVRYELMPKTYHFVAFFVQRELFPPEPRRGRRRRGGE